MFECTTNPILTKPKRRFPRVSGGFRCSKRGVARSWFTALNTGNVPPANGCCVATSFTPPSVHGAVFRASVVNATLRATFAPAIQIHLEPVVENTWQPRDCGIPKNSESAIGKHPESDCGQKNQKQDTNSISPFNAETFCGLTVVHSAVNRDGFRRTIPTTLVRYLWNGFAAFVTDNAIEQSYEILRITP